MKMGGVGYCTGKSFVGNRKRDGFTGSEAGIYSSEVR